MGSSRFLKAIKARHAGSALVVKVFVKDPHMDLRPTSKRMAGELQPKEVMQDQEY
jgi:phosphoinositide-3-kinase regulatory subunit 4